MIILEVWLMSKIPFEYVEVKQDKKDPKKGTITKHGGKEK